METIVAFMFITLLGTAPAQGKTPDSGAESGPLQCIEEALDQAERSWLADELDKDRDGRVGDPEIEAFVDREFAAADIDGDGSLTPAEYAAAWLEQEAGPTRDTGTAGGLSGDFAALTVSDYERDYAQFAQDLAEETGRECEPTVGEISALARVDFSADDRDADGVVTRSEFEGGEQAELSEEFADLDQDDDGRLSRSESLSALRTLLLELD